VRQEYFVDHYGGIHRCPAGETVHERKGIHGLLEHGDSVLMIRPPRANWLELPGGGVEDGETPLIALQRELMEEAGLELPGARLTSTRTMRLTCRYYALGRNAYWLYEQEFRLIHLDARPTVNLPLEPGHDTIWLPLADVHNTQIHHIHRLGMDRLLGLHD